MLRKLRNKFLLSLVLALAVTGALLIYADLRQVVQDLGDFQWSLLPVILGLTVLNYVLRFLKWEYFLRLIGVERLSHRDSLLIFIAGFAMTVTPGKVGEWLKSYLLAEVHAVPLARSAPVLLAERLTDGLAMLLLAAAGFVAFGMGWEVFIGAMAVSALFITAARYRPVTAVTVKLTARLPLLHRFVPLVEEASGSLYRLMSPSSLLYATTLGFVSWGFECLAYYLVVTGLGAPPSWDLLVKAAFILPLASLAGALFLLPGGLGAVEGGITGLAQVLVGLSRSAAAASALLIRLCTLWFGVSLGLVALAWLTRLLSQEQTPPVPSAPPEASALGLQASKRPRGIAKEDPQP